MITTTLVWWSRNVVPEWCYRSILSRYKDWLHESSLNHRLTCINSWLLYSTAHAISLVKRLPPPPNRQPQPKQTKKNLDTPTPTPQMICCLLSEQEQASAKVAMEKAFYASEERGLLCCKSLHGWEAMLKDELYKDWIALRDCVHVGKEQYRFSESQLLYHYIKDLKINICNFDMNTI